MSDLTQQSFAGGVISPSLATREDLAKQHVGLDTCLNMIITGAGSAKSRGGLLRVDQVENILYKHRLLPFIFSRDSAYVGVWGENTLQVIQNGAFVLRDIVDAATYKWTFSSGGTGEYHLELAAGGDPGLLEAQYVLEDGVKMTAATPGSLAEGESGFGDNDSLGYDTRYVRIVGSTDPDLESDGYLQIPFLIETPYTAVQNADHDWAQSADVEYLANKSFMPYKLTRVTDTSWTLALIDFKDGPWLRREDGDEDITLTPSAKTGAGITITSSATMLNAPAIGDHIRLGYESPFDSSIIEWGWAKITAVPSPTTLTATVQEDFGYEYLLNPEFTNDTSFWRDESTAASDSFASHDAVTGTLVLNKGTTGEALVRQEVSVPVFERMTFEIVATVVNTSIKVFIGTTIGGTDVLAPQTITTPGTYTYTTEVNEPQASPVYVTIWTNGAPVSSTHKISKVSLMRKGLGTPHWRNSSWSATKGYPSHVTLFDQRVVYAGGSLVDLSDTIWFTKIGAYESFPFSTPLIDTDSVVATLASTEVNAIQWIAPFGELVAGTTGQEWRIDSGGGDTITPTSISAKAKTRVGSSAVKPLIVGNSVLFLNKNANKVFALDYSFDADGYKPANLSILASHLLDGHTIVEWAYQAAPDSVVWCVRSDGKMLGLTYVEEQELWAWSVHETTGSFESVCVIPEGGDDVVYVSVNRKKTVAGFKVTRRYIEKMMPSISDADIYDYNCLDNSYTVDIENDIASSGSINGITYLASPVPPGETTNKEKIRISYPNLAGPIPIQENDYIYISGLVGPSELNGKTYRASDLSSGGGNLYFLLKDKEGDDYIDGKQLNEWVSGGEVRKGITSVFFAGLGYSDGTVGVMADGSYSIKNVTSTGNPASLWGFDLDEPAIVIHIGLLYNQDLKSLPLDFVASDGSTSQGKDKILNKINVQFNQSRNAAVGSGPDDLEDLSFNTYEQGNNPPPLQTITLDGTADGETSKTAHWFIRNNKPVPMEVTGVIADVNFKPK